ncbi:sulfatase-like hydrolase/transferase [Planctomycetota bacterium]
MLKFVSPLVCMGLATFVCGGRQAGTQPNFILIVADDLGYADVGFHGSTQIKTPFLDRLAEQGVVCTNGYVSAPVCSPSRAGLLTGRNQPTFGYDNNLAANQPGFDPEFGGLPVNEKTIADRLKKRGYVNGLIGKWHLGTLPQFHPLQRGFHEFWGFTGGGHNYFPSPPGKGYDAPIECNYKEPESITYITDDIGAEAVDFVRRHRNEPFFLFVSFNVPHTPMQATAEDLARYAHIKNKKRRTYCAMVHRLDVNIGRILETTEKTGLTDKTLIVFISDNGGPVDQNASMNAPLNGQKGILWEGGMRVPFVLRWTKTLPAGQTFVHAVSSLDLVPSFVNAAGEIVREEDKLAGVNLMPYLTGKTTTPPHPTLLWRFTISAAIRTGDWKLVRLPDRLPMLYNLKDDISEQHDVALDNPERTRTLLKQLGDWDVQLPHPLFLEGAIWKRRQLALYDCDYPLTQPSGN